MNTNALVSTIILVAMVSGVADGAVDRVELFREVIANQSNPSEVFFPQGAYSAHGRVVATDGYYQEGFLNFPSGFFLALSYADGSWQADAVYTDALKPFQGFPSGDYTFSFEKNTEWLSWTLPFGGGSFPAQPLLSNFADTQDIVPGSPLQLTWIPWAEASAGDVIEIELVDETDGVPQSVFLQGRTSDAPLAGSAGAFNIPTGNLEVGRQYVLYLRFVQTLLSEKNLIPSEPNVPVHCGNVASTAVALRFRAEGDRQTRFDWGCFYEQVWQTTSSHYLSPTARATNQISYRAIFSLEDWFSAPALQVKFWGPEGSGMLASPANFSSYTRRGISYHATLGYSSSPLSGSYKVSYKGVEYLFETAPPSAETIRYALPSVSLDDAGRVASLDWDYFQASSAETAEAPPQLESIGIFLQGQDGTVFLDELALDPDTTGVSFDSEGPPWDQVSYLQLNLRLSHGDDYSALYWITHLDHPAQVYFDGGNYSSGWCDNSWYGLFYADYWPWIYHLSHGWQYAWGDGELSILPYDQRLGWLWTKMSYYPFIYSFVDERWYWFDKDSTTPLRRFFDFSIGEAGAWRFEDDIIDARP